MTKVSSVKNDINDTNDIKYDNSDTIQVMLLLPNT